MGCGGQFSEGKTGIEYKVPHTFATPQRVLIVCIEEVPVTKSREKLLPSSWKLQQVMMAPPPLLLSNFIRQGFNWGTVTVWEDTIGQVFKGLGLAPKLYLSFFCTINSNLLPDAGLQSPIFL